MIRGWVNYDPNSSGQRQNHEATLAAKRAFRAFSLLGSDFSVTLKPHHTRDGVQSWRYRYSQFPGHFEEAPVPPAGDGGGLK